jgi:hypothetical protein
MPAKSQSTQSFSVYYDTIETSDHTMGASELGRALVALDEALVNADKIVNGEKSLLEVKVSAPKSGSIGIPLTVGIMDGSINILEILGLVASASFTSATVIETISFIKNRKISAVVRKDDGNSEITVSRYGKEESYEVDTLVEKLVTDTDIRDKLQEAFFSPVQNQSSPKIILKSFDGTQEFKTLDSEQIDSFKKLTKKTLTETEEKVKKVHVRFIDISFERESGWLVDYLGDKLRVSIEDNYFMNRNRSSQESFKSGDLFEVDLKTIITRHPERGTHAKFKITKVYRKIG